jgi:MioC protein
MDGVLDFSTAYPDILVLVGSRTGDAEVVAGAVAERLSNYGFQIHVVDLVKASASHLLDTYQVLVCSDGFGTDEASPLVRSLREESPDLTHLAYGLISIRDTPG